MQRRTLAVLALAGAVSLCGPAMAQTRHADPGVNERPSGTVVLTAKAVAAGVGYTWGDGTLAFAGHQYHFSVKGVDVADVGYAEVTGHGRVYHLRHVQDFTGTYVAATGEATLGNGIGGQYLRNEKGVMIRIDQVSQGARLTGSAGGIQLTLAR